MLEFHNVICYSISSTLKSFIASKMLFFMSSLQTFLFLIDFVVLLLNVFKKEGTVTHEE